MPSERELIAAIRRQCPDQLGEVVKGIGDDCAVLRPEGAARLTLLTVDTLVESVHFDRAWHPPELLGRKAAAVNLSDIAAMGGEPRFALLSLALPPELASGWVEQFMVGFLAALHEHGVVLIGGDTVKSGAEAVFTVTLLGEVWPGQVLYRSSARPGELVWISGTVGDAAAGLHLCRQGRAEGEASWATLVKAHLNPTPEVALGRLLAASGLVGAMMDTSDGLATDLAHLCAESGVGAEIEAAALPFSPALREVAKLFKIDPLDWGLKGGEDFRLLFTSAPEHGPELQALVRARAQRELYCIGRIVANRGVRLLAPEGAQEIAYRGYDHFAA